MTTSIRKSLAFWFLEFVPAKNQFIPSVHFWDRVNFRVPRPDWQHPLLTMDNQNNFYQLSIFVNLYQHEKNQFIPSLHSSDTVNFKLLSPGWPHTFLTMPTPKIFSDFLIRLNLYQHAKNNYICPFLGYSHIHFWPYLTK